MLPQAVPTFKISLPRQISPAEEDVCRERAYLHLKHLGANITKQAVCEVVEMIFRNPEFVKTMKQIMRTPLDEILGSLPYGSAGTRAKALLERRGIRDVESLVRLNEKDVDEEYGVGSETVTALRRTLRKHGLRLGMLLPRPLDANHAE